MLGPLQTIWVEALESGKYPQGAGQLKFDGKYCCLGVAVEVIPNCWSNSSCFLTQYEMLRLYSGEGALAKPAYKEGIKFIDLVGMNDGENNVSFTFAEIAAYIRANPENVFSEAV